MGDYLSKPNIERHTDDGENGVVILSHNSQIRYGVCAMQGWRKSMEDSHITKLDLGDGVSLFGVFDGHGGTILNFLTLFCRSGSSKVHRKAFDSRIEEN